MSGEPEERANSVVKQASGRGRGGLHFQALTVTFRIDGWELERSESTFYV